MDTVVVGIDVSKIGLDVHVLPAGEAFAVGRDAAGIDALIERLRPLAPAMVAATGGLRSRPVTQARVTTTVVFQSAPGTRLGSV
jgi:transposase